jgi:hypothetical protein
VSTVGYLDLVEGIAMKTVALLLSLFSFSAFAQDVAAQLSLLDSKVYSLKTKGVTDFVVDIQSSRLTKQVNDQAVFGVVKELVFRTFWTANPERVAIEVMGLPEGFKEVKEELKANIMMIFENLLPLSTQARLAGYKITSGSKPKEFIAQDTTGVAAIPSFILKYDAQDKLLEVEGKKTVGTFNVTYKYDKESFSDGKYVLESTLTVATENGQTITTKKELDYGKSQGIGVLEEVEIETEQKSEKPGSKVLKSDEEVSFKNYKINTGDALKYFLSEGSKN